MEIKKSFKELAWYNQATIVTTSGKVIQRGNQGLIVIDGTKKTEILAIDEVSDDSVINTFIHLNPNAGIMVNKSVGMNVDSEMVTDIEILIKR